MSNKNIKDENPETEKAQQEQAETVENKVPLEENGTENWEEKYNEINDKYLRLYSEFDNFRKRSMKEKVDILGQASTEVIKDLLPILDDFDRAFASNDKNSESFYDGMALIQNKFKKTLEDKGLKPIESTGKDFDVELHEAITNVPAPSKKEKGKVVDTIEKGYYFKDKILRYAKVVVGQ